MLKLLFLVVTLALVVVVTTRGRSDERASAAVLILASLLSPLVSAHRFHAPELGVMLVDFAVLAWLVRTALTSDRYWPLWAAGFQVVGVMIHFARLVAPDIWVLAYSNAEIFWAYPVYFALMIGAALEAPARLR